MRGLFAADDRHRPGCDQGQELVLVIGGETHGVSERARKFAHEHLGERVHVPLANSMDSLNVVSAASVILFEIKRAVEIADKVE